MHTLHQYTQATTPPNQPKRARHNTGQTSTNQDTDLAQTLLHMLQQHHYQDDTSLAKSIIAAMHQHQGQQQAKAPTRKTNQQPHTASRWTPHRQQKQHPAETHTQTFTRWHKRSNTPQPIQSLTAAEWSKQPQLGTTADALTAIKAGNTPTLNIVEVTAIDQANDLKTYWTTHACTCPITIIHTAQAAKAPGLTYTNAKLQRKHQPWRVEHIGLSALGKVESCPWPKPATSFKTTTIPQQARGTLRVACPYKYRQLFVKKDGAHQIITAMANWPTNLPTSKWMGGKWQKQCIQNQELIVGFIPMLEKDITDFLPLSGTHGIFLNKLDEANTRRSIQWQKPLPDETTEIFYTRCLAQAQTSKQPLLFRKGSHTDLGVPHSAAEASTHREQNEQLPMQNCKEAWLFRPSRSRCTTLTSQ